MTVKCYVGRDSQQRPWPPDSSHETQATIDIIKRLWRAFNSKEDLFAVVANLHRPSADMVIISKRGLGVIELKHYYNRISQKSGGIWYAGPKQIEAGSKSKGYSNPHEQVRAYAEQIRIGLTLSKKQPAWLPGNFDDWRLFKIQTIVCFTHPDAIVDNIKKTVRRDSRPKSDEWEEFTVLTPQEVPDWVAALRFDTQKDWEDGFEPHCLTSKQILNIAERLLGGTEWTEIIDLMPTGDPYAYLARIEDGQRVQVFGLDREEVCLGRDAHSCAVPIPERFTLVSRNHARITRTVQGIFIKDESKNGTCVDGRRIPKKKSRRLGHGQKITLGGKEPGDRVPQLEISLKVEFKPALTETDLQPD
jgi:hypothetical protein